MSESGPDHDIAWGHLVVRASGAAALGAAMSGRTADPVEIQLAMRCRIPARIGADGVRLRYTGYTLHVQPVNGSSSSGQRGIAMVTVPVRQLSLGVGELKPLMFHSVPVEAEVHTLFTTAIATLLAAGSVVDERGAGCHLLGLAELVLRSTLRAELHRADAIAHRRGEAERVMRARLSDPDLSADVIAEELFISRRRLYQLFADGDGIQGRIRALRIERAKELLADPAKGHQSVGDIAADCGFVSPAHFSRTFRRIVGQPPRSYRDAHTHRLD